MVIDVTYLNEASNNKNIDSVYGSMSREQQEMLSKVLVEKYKYVFKEYASLKIPPKLKRVSFDCGENFFNKFPDGFYMTIDAFGNYPYEGLAENDDDDTINKLLDENKKDLITMQHSLQSKCKNAKIVLMDENGYGPNEYIEFVKKYKWCSNEIAMYVFVSKKDCVKLMPSDSDIKESNKKKYIELFDGYAKFMKHPTKLTGNLWAGHLSDISRIIGISIKEFNEIVSKNIGHPSGKRINGEWFDDSKYGKSIEEKLGDCVILNEFSDADQLVYSIPNKKVYWINFEHCDMEEFFSNFPMNSREFERVLFDDTNLKKEIFELFKARDKEKRYGLINK